MVVLFLSKHSAEPDCYSISIGLPENANTIVEVGLMTYCKS